MNKLRYTPLHPQWFAYLLERKRYQFVGKLASGRTLDIGCGRQNLRSYLDPQCEYTSLDGLTTGDGLYGARPDVFGDARQLPFKDSQFDTVVMLEILEHLDQPDQALRDARRLLKSGGKLIVSTPFLYPIHDAPWDFQRWTQYGLRHLAESSGAHVEELRPLGNTIASGCLIMNLALAWQTLNSPLLSRIPLLLLAVLAIPLINLFAATASLVAREPGISRFAIGYLMVLGDERC